MHTHLPLGSTRHLLAYINTVLGMLGGTRTTYAGNCSRCGQWKPPHAATVAPIAFHLRVQQRDSSFRANEQNLCTCLFCRFISSPALSSWRVRVGAFQNIYLALTLVSRRRPMMCCLSPPSSSSLWRLFHLIQMEKASLWHRAGLHSDRTEEGCHATHVNLTDRTFQGKNVPGEFWSCLKSYIWHLLMINKSDASNKCNQATE